MRGICPVLDPKIYSDGSVRLRMRTDNFAATNPDIAHNYVQLRVCPICGAAEENEVHFILVCQALNLLRNVCINIPPCRCSN